MTDAQLAALLRHIRSRLADGLDAVEAAHPELSEEHVDRMNIPTRWFPVLQPLRELEEDLDDDIETLMKSAEAK